MFFRNHWRTLLWALFILIITGIPGSYFPGVKTFWEWLQPDKIVHVVVFSILSFTILYDTREQYLEGNRRSYYVAIAVGGASAYGMLTEILQHSVFIGRSGNVFDAMADVVGAFIGWWLFELACRKKIIKNSNSTPN